MELASAAKKAPWKMSSRSEVELLGKPLAYTANTMLILMLIIALAMANGTPPLSHRWRPGSGWPKLYWCWFSSSLSAGSPITCSTCTAPSTTSRWTCRCATWWLPCWPASSASPHPASTPSLSTCSVRASGDISTGATSSVNQSMTMSELVDLLLLLFLLSQLRCGRGPRPQRQVSYLHSTSHIRLTSFKKATPTIGAVNGSSARQEVAL